MREDQAARFINPVRERRKYIAEHPSCIERALGKSGLKKWQVREQLSLHVGREDTACSKWVCRAGCPTVEDKVHLLTCSVIASKRVTLYARLSNVALALSRANRCS